MGHVTVATYGPPSVPAPKTCIHQAASVFLERAHRPRKGTVEARRTTQLHRHEAIDRAILQWGCSAQDLLCTSLWQGSQPLVTCEHGSEMATVIFKCKLQARADCLIGQWHWPAMPRRKADIRGSQKMSSRALPRYLCSLLPVEEEARAGSQGYHGTSLPLDPISHRGQITELRPLAQLGVMMHTFQRPTRGAVSGWT